MKLKNCALLFSLTIVLFSFYSCKKAIYNQLTEDEIKWLIYNQGDQMIFTHSVAVKDTFIFTSRVRGYIKDKPHYNESASVNFVNPTDTIGGNTVGTVRLSKDDANNFSCVISFPHFPKKAELTTLIPLSVDTINGIAYTNVYVIEADPFTTSDNNYFNKIYYSRESGFLKAEDIYNRTWFKTN